MESQPILSVNCDNSFALLSLRFSDQSVVMKIKIGISLDLEDITVGRCLKRGRSSHIKI